ncbi:MAG: AMP-binding protein [Pseudomonadales bacterium]
MSKRLLVTRDCDSVYANVAGRSITVGEFLADVEQCAESLPDSRYQINLCGERYSFSVAFFAAAVRGQTNLLPSKRSQATLASLRTEYGSVTTLSDDPHAAVDQLLEISPGGAGSTTSPNLDTDCVVAVAFTSGSTGQPQPHAKPWGLLSRGRHIHARHLPGNPQLLRGLVATVPSWHMYGLEWALMMPTAAEFAVYCGNDFFPGDVVAALDSFSEPSVLVSTPIHLKALLKAPAPLQPVSETVCATAPLAATLAKQVEQHLGTRLFEIYGCSELGSLASRFTVQENSWEFFPEFSVQQQEDQLTVQTEQLPEVIELADRFAAAPGNRYELLGRASDIIKVAGKRESLANLNSVLLNIDGVEDGLFYQPEAMGLADSGRLGAVVVAPTLSDATLKARLAEQLDSAFLPRPIHRLRSLPRESTSKLSIDTLRKLLRDASKEDHA